MKISSGLYDIRKNIKLTLLKEENLKLTFLMNKAKFLDVQFDIDTKNLVFINRPVAENILH